MPEYMPFFYQTLAALSDYETFEDRLTRTSKPLHPVLSRSLGKGEADLVSPMF